MASPLAPMSQALQDPSSLAFAGWELTSPHRSPISGSVSQPLGPGGASRARGFLAPVWLRVGGGPGGWTPELVSDHRAHCSDLYAEILVKTSLNYCGDHWFWKWEGERSGTVLRYMVSDCLGTASRFAHFCCSAMSNHVHTLKHLQCTWAPGIWSQVLVGPETLHFSWASGHCVWGLTAWPLGLHEGKSLFMAQGSGLREWTLWNVYWVKTKAQIYTSFRYNFSRSLKDVCSPKMNSFSSNSPLFWSSEFSPLIFSF